MATITPIDAPEEEILSVDSSGGSSESSGGSSESSGGSVVSDDDRSTTSRKRRRRFLVPIVVLVIIWCQHRLLPYSVVRLSANKSKSGELDSPLEEVPSCIPIDCEVSSWESWTPCSAQCDGMRSHERDVVRNADCNGESCPHLYEEEICNKNCCVDCEVTPWSDWSPCSADCDGIRTRTRTINFSNDECGQPCPDDMEETEACNPPIDCRLSPWSEWTDCSFQGCGGAGTRTRTRTIEQAPNSCGEQCGDLTQTEACMTEPCEEEDACDPNPCVHGECVALGAEAYTCNCIVGWTGEHCDTECFGNEDCIEPGQKCSLNSPAYCSVAVGTCVYCDRQEDCLGSEVCDCDTGICKPTADDPECPPPKFWSNKHDPPCGYGNCVNCDTEDDCDSDEHCNCSIGECVVNTVDDTECYCTEGQKCSLNSPAYCSVAVGTCVYCDRQEDCLGSEVCDCDTGICKPTADDPECPPPKFWSNKHDPPCGYGNCVNCDTEDDCDSDEHCNCSIGECVDDTVDDTECYCTEGQKCSLNSPAYCSVAVGTCVYCDRQEDCLGSEVCDCDTGICKPTADDPECPPPKFWSNKHDPPCGYGNCVNCDTEDDCYSDESCNCSIGECECDYDCCSDSDCNGDEECSSNQCVNNLLPTPQPQPDCPHECCDNSDCSGGKFCSDNPSCAFGECVNCDTEDDCDSDESCNCSIGECECDYECCSDSDCNSDESCSSNQCVPDCPHECCDNSDCSGSKFCSDNPSCASGECVNCDTEDDCDSDESCNCSSRRM